MIEETWFEYFCKILCEIKISIQFFFNFNLLNFSFVFIITSWYLTVCTCMHITCLQVPVRTKRAIDLPELELQGQLKCLFGFWEWNLVPLKEQQAFNSRMYSMLTSNSCSSLLYFLILQASTPAFQSERLSIKKNTM